MTEIHPSDLDKLIVSLEQAKWSPDEAAWQIYHFLKGNYKEVGSQMARQLLFTYLHLPVSRPSYVHSCILSAALHISETYADFRLPSFLEYWGYEKMLREEDRIRRVGKNGREHLSLYEKTERHLQSYRLHHADSESAGASSDVIMPMIAVKMHETERNGRRIKSVKLISPDGTELLADSHLFPCKPWEICGRMFNVLTRQGRGALRVQEIALTQRSIADVFSVVTGYVEYYDAAHRHYHVYDSLSRHYVAENPPVQPAVGSFVLFSPVVPAQNGFKSAVIHSVLPADEGRRTFGTYAASVTYINKEKDYFYYDISSDIPATPEGEIAAEGSARLSLSSSSLSVGDSVRLVLFLKRGKDRQKRNYVVEVIKEDGTQKE